MVLNMQEYWVNVYPHGIAKQKFKARYEARLVIKGIYGENAIYRIHVKMKEAKPKYDPSFKYLTDRISNETGKFNWKV